MRRRDVLTFGSAALAVRGLTTTARAASNYPERPVRLIIPFPPGGGFDAIGRPWADRIKPLLGTIVVENQGGGGSSLGAATADVERATNPEELIAIVNELLAASKAPSS